MLIRSDRALRRPEARLTRLLTPFSIETRSVDSDKGTFSGWASTAAIDSYGSILAPGAFNDSLAEHARNGSMPAMLWQHDWYEVCGRWFKIEQRDAEGKQGLWCEGGFELATQRGREGNALIRPDPTPALNGLSVGFEPDWEAAEWVDDVLVFHKAKLWEISVVTFPANDDARIEMARGVDDVQTERDLEHILRDAGYTRSEAVTIASRFKTKGNTNAPRDAAPDVFAAIRAALSDLKGAIPAS